MYNPITIAGQTHASILSDGRIDVLFQSDTGRHADVDAANGLRSVVVGRLRDTVAFKRHQRTLRELESCETAIRLGNFAARLELMSEKRRELIVAQDNGLGAALTMHDRSVKAIVAESESLAAQRDLLAPIVAENRSELDRLAKSLVDDAATEAVVNLTAQEAAAGKELGKKATDAIAALIAAKVGVKSVTAYRNSDCGRAIVDAALAK